MSWPYIGLVVVGGVKSEPFDASRTMLGRLILRMQRERPARRLLGALRNGLSNCADATAAARVTEATEVYSAEWRTLLCAGAGRTGAGRRWKPTAV